MHLKLPQNMRESVVVTRRFLLMRECRKRRGSMSAVLGERGREGGVVVIVVVMMGGVCE